MSDPIRLRDGGANDARAARLVEGAATIEPWPESDRQETWRRIATRGEPSRTRLWWLATATAGALAGLGAFFVVHPSPQPSPLSGERETAAVIPSPLPKRGRGQGEGAVGTRLLDLGSVGTLEADAATVYDVVPGNQTVHLASGRVCATIHHRDAPTEGPFVVLAPSLRIVDVGTRFCVSAAGGRTTVDVTEGEVRVEAEGGRSVDVRAGQRVDSADARLAAPVPVLAPRPPSRCDTLDGLEARERCFAATATGDDLAAQNALYSLALLARDQRHEGPTALTLLRTYLQRFPRGPLAPEASLGVLAELSAEARYGDAASEARRYVDAFPTEAKAAEVRLILANLERERLGQPAEARDAYQAALRTAADPEVQGEALFGLGLTEVQLGQRDEAQATLRRYQAEHPTGARAADVARLLGR